MSRASETSDPAMLQVVQDLLNQETVVGRERRQSQRRVFNCVQLLAPYDGKRLPAQAEFRPVRCRDLSTQGFSFYTIERPAHRQVIVALGEIPFTFVVAEIRNVQVVERQGRNQYMVGCRFVRRLS